MSFDGSTVLVVGGAGFVGSNLVKELLAANARRVIVVDNLLSSDAFNIPETAAVEFVFGSINDRAVLARLEDDIDYAFHLACFHGNQSSIAEPFTDHENNTLTSLSLFNHLSTFSKLKKVVYAAAACAVAEKTFDEASATTEDQPVSLYHDSPYSISKIVGELYANYFHARAGLPVVKARFANVYGPGEILGAGRWRGTVNTVWRNVVPTFVWRALHHEALPLDNGGNASRDFIFVRDMARGLMSCALKGEAGGVYNLATGVETTILQLAETINELADNPTPVDLKPARDWDRSGKRFASTEKAERELGFKASVGIEQGLQETVEWTRSNRAVIERCIAQHSKMMQQAV